MNQEKKSVPVCEVPPAECPAPEKISAFLDGEEKFTPEEEAHFYSCPKCQKLFRSYRNMGVLLEEALEEEMKKLPGSERILEKVHERLCREYGVFPEESHRQKESFSFVGLRHFARVAAGLLFLLFAFLLLIIMGLGKERTLSVPVASVEKREFSTPEKSTSFRTFSSVDIGSLIPAASGERRVEFLPGSQRGKKLPVLIPYQVKQLWLIPFGTARKELEKLLGAPLQKKGKELILEKTLDRRKSVALVRLLASRKYKLLTPVPPQPEDTHFLGTGNEKVQLHLTFLPEE